MVLEKKKKKISVLFICTHSTGASVCCTYPAISLLKKPSITSVKTFNLLSTWQVYSIQHDINYTHRFPSCWVVLSWRGSFASKMVHTQRGGWWGNVASGIGETWNMIREVQLTGSYRGGGRLLLHLLQDGWWEFHAQYKLPGMWAQECVSLALLQ